MNDIRRYIRPDQFPNRAEYRRALARAVALQEDYDFIEALRDQADAEGEGVFTRLFGADRGAAEASRWRLPALAEQRGALDSPDRYGAIMRVLLADLERAAAEGRLDDLYREWWPHDRIPSTRPPAGRVIR